MECGNPSGLLRGAVPLPAMSVCVRDFKELFSLFGLVQEGGFALPSCGGMKKKILVRYFFPFTVYNGVPCVGLDGLAVHDGGFDCD